MSNPVLDAISNRRSIRAYTPAPLSGEQLDALIKAALESPSARDSQPWHFTVVRDRALLADINAETVHAMSRPGDDIFYAAPVVIFISQDPAKPDWATLDCGIAVQNLALAAQGLGLGSVILGLPRYAFEGARAAEFERRLKFPDGYTFAIAIAVGYAAATKDAHPLDYGKVEYVGN